MRKEKSAVQNGEVKPKKSLCFREMFMDASNLSVKMHGAIEDVVLKNGGFIDCRINDYGHHARHMLSIMHGGKIVSALRYVFSDDFPIYVYYGENYADAENFKKSALEDRDNWEVCRPDDIKLLSAICKSMDFIVSGSYTQKVNEYLFGLSDDGSKIAVVHAYSYDDAVRSFHAGKYVAEDRAKYSKDYLVTGIRWGKNDESLPTEETITLCRSPWYGNRVAALVYLKKKYGETPHDFEISEVNSVAA